jgi:iron complex outermembrane receptor protein
MWGDVKGTDQFYPEYDDPSTNDGIADDLDWERYYGLQTRVTYQNLSLQGIWSLRQAGIPTGAWEIVFNDRTAQTKDQSGFVELKYDLDLAVDKNLMIRGYYDHYGYAGTYPYEIDSTIVKNYDASDGRWLGGETQFRWDIRTNNRLSLGLEFQKHVSRSYQLWTPEEIYFDGDFPSHVVSFYAQDELQLVDNLAFTFGLRSDKYSNLESHITPRAALVYNPMPYSAVKLLYGQAYRAPNIYEMYYEDPLIGYKPNLALDREKIQTLELVWEHRITEGLFGTLSLYNYKMNDLIEQSIDPIDSSFQYRNIGRVVASGVEVDFHARVKQKLHGYVNYSLQKAMNSDLEVKLTNSPTHLLKLGLWYPAMNYLSLAAEWQYESERLTLQDTRTRPFLLTNLKLSTRQLFKDARLSLIVRNVFDVDYQTPAGYEHRQAAITQSGRDVTLRLELTK